MSSTLRGASFSYVSSIPRDSSLSILSFAVVSWGVAAPHPELWLVAALLSRIVPRVGMSVPSGVVGVGVGVSLGLGVGMGDPPSWVGDPGSVGVL